MEYLHNHAVLLSSRCLTVFANSYKRFCEEIGWEDFDGRRRRLRPFRFVVMNERNEVITRGRFKLLIRYGYFYEDFE